MRCPTFETQKPGKCQCGLLQVDVGICKAIGWVECTRMTPSFLWLGGVVVSSRHQGPAKGGKAAAFSPRAARIGLPFLLLRPSCITYAAKIVEMQQHASCRWGLCCKRPAAPAVAQGLNASSYRNTTYCAWLATNGSHISKKVYEFVVRDGRTHARTLHLLVLSVDAKLPHPGNVRICFTPMTPSTPSRWRWRL